MKTKKMFVYGSLMENFFNYDKYLKGHVIEIKRGCVYGTLYHLHNKGYPGYIREGNDPVFGEIITFKLSESLQNALDKLEGYRGEFHLENAYNRCQLEVFESNTQTKELLDVYVYNMDASKNQEDQRLYLRNGSWRKYMENK